MPRAARVAGEFQHIVVRGVGRQILFEDDMDRLHFLKSLRRFRDDTETVLLAYCLMENHVHLLVHAPGRNAAELMKKLGVSYAYYFNRKYDRTGHLFQDRYRSETITDDAYLLSAYRYILENPEKAGIAAAQDYPWSSYREYGRTDGLTDTGMLKDMIGSFAAFEELMKEKDPFECLEAEPVKHDDLWAEAVIRQELGIGSGTELQRWPHAARDEAVARLRSRGLTIRQLERLTGISRGILQKKT